MRKECKARRPRVSHSRRGGRQQRAVARALPAASLAAAVLLGGCGVQSTFTPASVEADSLALLFRVMAIGAGITWLAVMAFAVYATLLSPRRHDARLARRIIVGGGVVLPVIVLAALLAYGLALMPDLRASVPEKNLRIAVSGEQWWWRVTYRLPDGRRVKLANEIRLPVGESVEFLLSSPDVIHSFWIPALAGKVDMTPGRTTRLVVTPNRPGTYRGACAEYCGTSHARMNFHVEVMERAAFTRWLERQAAPARAPASAIARRGHAAFIENGCGACHTIRGTKADGTVGPDLTHVGSRPGIAAGTLVNEPDTMRRWLEDPQRFKPGVHMPAFGMLPPEDLRAIAAYLDELR